MIIMAALLRFSFAVTQLQKPAPDLGRTLNHNGPGRSMNVQQRPSAVQLAFSIGLTRAKIAGAGHRDLREIAADAFTAGHLDVGADADRQVVWNKHGDIAD